MRTAADVRTGETLSARVIVTGSRHWTDATLIRQVLDDLLTEHGPFVLVHGACRTGADAIADRWARERRSLGDDVRVVRFPANWGRYGKAAGPMRNERMVAAGADLCLAFYQPGALNQGTDICRKLADAAGIPVHRYPQEAA